MIRWLHFKRGLARSNYEQVMLDDGRVPEILYDKRLGELRFKGKSIYIDIDPRWERCADWDDVVTIRFEPIRGLYKAVGINRGGKQVVVTLSEISWVAGRTFDLGGERYTRQHLLDWLSGICQCCKAKTRQPLVEA